MGDLTPREDCGATFFVARRTGQVIGEQDENRSHGLRRIEADLHKYCEPPVRCYWNPENGEVCTVFSRINRDGSGAVINKRRKISARDRTSQGYCPLELTKTSDGYGFEQQFKISLNSFQTAGSPPPTPNIISPAIARARTKRSKLGKRLKLPQERKCDSQLLKERLELHRNDLGDMCYEVCQNRHLRCIHWYQDGRSFAFASAFIETDLSRKAVLGLFWHTKTRPHRAACLSFSLESMITETEVVPPGNVHEELVLVANCTCCHLLSQTKGTLNGCYHAQICLGDERFVEVVSREILRREENEDLQEKGDNIFAECIGLEEGDQSSEHFTILLNHGASKGKTLATPWMFFMTFDVDLHIFVPVLKLAKKAFRCLLCRIPSSTRGSCVHEDDSRNVCKLLMRQGGGGNCLDFGFLNEDDNSDNNESDSDRVNGDETTDISRPNRSITVPEVYIPINVRRPILPCRGEWVDMERITRALDALKENEVLVIEERNKATCHKCGLLNKKENYEGYAREIYLFTLNQGTHKIKVYDWWCGTCEEKRNFSGRGTGVFPAQRNSAFTTELLYQWLQMTCFQGYSFRSAYQTTRGIQRSVSTVMRNKKIRRSTLHISEEDAMSRRRANDALRAFIALLDTNSSMMTSTYFTCKNCEVPLTPADCTELGISEEEGKGFKRFKAVVIDGTAAGILTDLPTLERCHEIVPAPKSTLSSLQKLVKRNPHRKALRHLMKIAKHCLREWKEKMSKNPSSTEHDNLRFWIKKSGGDSSGETSISMTETECKVVQLFLSDAACFCPTDLRGRPGLRDSWHTTECGEVRKAFLKAKEHPEISTVLRKLFSITQGNPAHNPQSNEREETRESSQTISEDENQGNLNQGIEDEAQDEEEDDDDVQDEGDGTYENVTRHQQVSGVWTTLLPPNADKKAQLIETTLLLLDFLLLQNVAMPYVGRLTVEGTTNNNTEREKTMLSFTAKSMQVHSNLISAMETYTAPCRHAREGRSLQARRKECACVSGMKDAALTVTRANPNLGAFCQELLTLRRPMNIAYKDLVESIIAVLKLHMATARIYFSKLERKCSEQCKTYWNSWGKLERYVEGQSGVQSPTSPSQQGRLESNDEDTRDEIPGEEDNHAEASRLAEEELKEGQKSGICFPGRKRCRPCIIFTGNNGDGCTKHYKKSNSHSPGLMTVQCACNSPKLIGFIVMLQAESTALALSAFLSHFRILPRTVYYDNACNLFLSVMLRVPWILERTRLAVDRFHFKSHTCCSYFDPDAYCEFDSQQTETAESINARIEKTLNQVRYLNGEQVIPYLRARFSFINLAATFKAMYDRDDLEEVDMINFFQETFKCSCERCTELENE